jgi:hypothetical protein
MAPAESFVAVGVLRDILLALQQSRNAVYVEVFWEKIIIFAPQVRQKSLKFELFYTP